MKVLLFNGSPNANGCTAAALKEVAASLEGAGIETELLQIGHLSVRGCTACGGCAKSKRCVFGDKDGLNDVIEACKNADGFVFGSPVYYASANGTLLSYMDRLFHAASGYLAHKPAAAVASARRAGTTATLDIIQKYFTINQMPIVSSTYWNMVHGSNARADQANQDLEGMQTMRNLGMNMAWLLQCIEAGKQAGIPLPDTKKTVWTNFI